MVSEAGTTGYPGCRLLALIGSGETSPTMVTVHRDLLSRLGRRRPQALLLATPYAFQENAASVSARARRYFADSVGLEVRIALGTSPDAGPEVAPPMAGETADEAEETPYEAGETAYGAGETAYGAGSSGRSLGRGGPRSGPTRTTTSGFSGAGPCRRRSRARCHG